MKHTFTATIQRLEGKIKWSVIYFPHSAEEQFGTNARVNVNARVDGRGFATTLLPSRNGHYFVYNAAMKAAVGKALGDTVKVTLERATEERQLVVPDYLTMALQQSGSLKAFSAQPYYIRRETIVHVESAKREETRAARIQKVIARLAGK